MRKTYKEVYEDLDLRTFVEALSFLLDCRSSVIDGWLCNFDFYRTTSGLNTVCLTVQINSNGFDSQEIKKTVWSPSRTLYSKKEWEDDKKEKLKTVQENIEEFKKLKKILHII